MIRRECISTTLNGKVVHVHTHLAPAPLPCHALPFSSPVIRYTQMYEMVDWSAQAGSPTPPAGVGSGAAIAASAATGLSSVGSGGIFGGAASSSSGTSGRDQFLKTLNWDGPAGDPRERGHYSRWVFGDGVGYK